ncbi:tRNA-binding protein [Pacificimonas flava]|uniref:Protein secretion chaperonin CsaA n=1 Tax=Pacificimonas flava TaxID=1234595 RepID=M2TBW6_9SPHN|nr:tRNA-binding protein [Pacificimonas flava]EMD84124.1 Protein secretion chaperonin CsaA [Pacificimonas flava]MBB5279999.1 tRNA-binding protein [Pacificimonas flava]
MHIVHDPAAPAAAETAFDTFLGVDIRAGTITDAKPFPEARQPSYRLTVDCGPGIGICKSVARITEHYTPESLIGRRVLAVVNFAPRQIGPARSEILILGLPDESGAILLVEPDIRAPNGARLS